MAGSADEGDSLRKEHAHGIAQGGRLLVGAATRRLEIALGGAVQGSPFAAAMKGSSEVVEALQREVEGAYRIGLS